MAAVGCLAVVGAMDYYTRPELTFAVFYLAPTLFLTWVAGRNVGMPIAALAIGVWGVTDALTVTGEWHVVFWNAAIRLGGFLAGVWLVDRLRAARKRLEAELARRTEEWEAERARRIEAEREIEGFSDREQQRLARELHDGVVQELGALAFEGQMLASDLAAARNPLKREAERFVASLNASITQMRSFGRVLDPFDGGMCGLGHALQRLVDDSGRALKISCTLETSGEVPPLPIQSQIQCYRLAQEAIHSAAEHGHAESVKVVLAVGDNSLVLEIEDDGTGFEPAGPGTNGRSSGLRLMRHRARLLGATLDTLRTERLGCKVRCILPLVEPAPAAYAGAGELRPSGTSSPG